ncbi:MAG: hypothetical protein RR515_04435 [Clostridium sp.]
MKKTVQDIMEQLKFVVIIYGIIILVHIMSPASGSKLTGLMVATAVSFSMVFIALVLKNFVKKPNLPGFAWATMVAFFLTLPISPVQEFILSSMSSMSFSLVGLPLVAFAGISVGDQLDVFKKLSWKIVVVSFVVMGSTYFFSAIIANAVLASKGML